MSRLTLCASVLAVCLLTLAQASREQYDHNESDEMYQFFEEWKLNHGKLYRTEGETMERFSIFKNNLEKIEDLNSRPKDTADSAVFGLNQFSDMTEDEFRNTVLMSYSATAGMEHKIRRPKTPGEAPESFDWTTKSGVVTSVKNQGAVGTCWAFTGCANVESMWSIKSGKPSPDLSPQALNDCDGYSNLQQGAVACGPLGATMPGFYYWVMKEGGLMTEKDYPYCSGTESCSPCEPPNYNADLCGGDWPIHPCKEEDSCAAKYNPDKFVPGLKVKDFSTFPQDEEELLDSVVETGPLVAGIDATDMQFYIGGILEPILCDPDRLNHAVLLVGYDTTEDGTKFWRAKNSWGTGWGEEGFLRIVRGGGACGINADVSSVVLE